MNEIIDMKRVGHCTPNKETVQSLAKRLKEKYSAIWWNSCREFPKLSQEMTFGEQRVKEREMNHFIKVIRKQLEGIPEKEEEQKEWRRETGQIIREFAEGFLPITRMNMNLVFKREFAVVIQSFIKQAKEFDAAVKFEDIGQALRNVLIMNVIQVLLGYDVTFSSAIFAYSMLYPYTDNYLDQVKISKEEKILMNDRFEQRLRGIRLEPGNNYEEQLFRLVEMIENQYDRSSFSKVYESLLSIHQAQVKSLLQQGERFSPYEKDILGMSFEKGGTSVMADGFLVGGQISETAAEFTFAYGSLLQLCDDLQDTKEDDKSKHMTIFSQTKKHWRLDNITNQLFHYIIKSVNFDENPDLPKLKEIQDIIIENCFFLMFEAIVQNKALYSRQYMKKMKRYFPFRLGYMKRFYKKLTKEYKLINRKAKGELLNRVLTIDL